MPSSRSRLRRAHVVALVFVLAVLPSAGLAWATWQLLAQYGEVERRQRQDRLDRAAEQIVSALRTAAAESRRALAVGEQVPAGAIAVTLHRWGVTVAPLDRIAFLPVPAPLPDERDDAAARDIALLARARDLTDMGRNVAALELLGEIRGLRPFSIAGTPSWVAVRYMRCRIFERSGQQATLRVEASRLVEDMHVLRSYLSPAVFQLYAEDATRWTYAPLPPESVALSAAADLLWQRWSAGGAALNVAGAEVLGGGDDQTVAIWEPSRDTLRAVVATQAFVDAAWMPRIRSVAAAHQVSVALGPSGAPATSSRTVDTHDLPWAVTVAATSEIADAANKRRFIVIASFFTLVLVVAVATTRAIGRELAVAVTKDGALYFVRNESGVELFVSDLRTDGRVGAPARLATGESGRNFWPASSPDRRFIAYVRQRTGGPPYALVAHSMPDHTERVFDSYELTAGAPEWFADGMRVLVTEVVPQPPQRGARPRPLIANVVTGTITPAVESERPQRSVRIALPAGTAGEQRNTLLSPDGARIASVVAERGTNTGSLWLAAADGQGARQLAAPANTRMLAWAADSSAIYFLEPRGDDARLMRIPVAGGPPLYAGLTLPLDRQRGATLAGNQLVFSQKSALSELWVVRNFAVK